MSRQSILCEHCHGMGTVVAETDERGFASRFEVCPVCDGRDQAEFAPEVDDQYARWLEDEG